MVETLRGLELIFASNFGLVHRPGEKTGPLEGHDHLGRDDPGESAQLTGTASCLLDDNHRTQPASFGNCS